MLEAPHEPALGRARPPALGNPTTALHEARAVLGLTIDYHRQFAALGDRLATQPMAEAALARVLAELYPDDGSLGGRAARSRRAAREAVMTLFREGATVGNAPGSQWAAWNAIVEFHFSLSIGEDS